MSSNGNIWQRFDYPLFVVSVILVVFGVLMIRSATLDAVDPTLISRVPDQIRYALMGVVIIF
ncbi:MAG: hypothetical protein AAFV33_06525, partial [Chloroflexota bacterium]